MEKVIRRENTAAMTGFRAMVMTALFAALGYVATRILQIPTPSGGYVNLGDTVVILGAYLLGPVYGAVAGGIGPALADLLSGYAIYVPATLVIKAVMALLAALVYRALGKKTWSMVVCAVAAEAVMIVGYWLFETVLAAAAGEGSFMVCLAACGAAGIPGNLVQAAFGIAAYTLLALALRQNTQVRRQFPNL